MPCHNDMHTFRGIKWISHNRSHACIYLALVRQVLAFCCNRGPLVGPWTVSQMVPILLMPIYPAPTSADSAASGRLGDDAGSPSTLLKRCIAKIGVSVMNGPGSVQIDESQHGPMLACLTAVLGTILPVLKGQYNLHPFLQATLLSKRYSICIHMCLPHTYQPMVYLIFSIYF